MMSIVIIFILFIIYEMIVIIAMISDLYETRLNFFLDAIIPFRRMFLIIYDSFSMIGVKNKKYISLIRFTEINWDGTKSIRYRIEINGKLIDDLMFYESQENEAIKFFHAIVDNGGSLKKTEIIEGLEIGDAIMEKVYKTCIKD